MKPTNRMHRSLGFLGWAMLVSLVLSAVLVVTAASMAGSPETAMVQIDGVPLSLASLDVGHWLLALGGLALALLIVALVVPLAVLIPLVIVLVVLVGALLAVAGVLAIVFSPLIFALLLLWLIVRLIRRGQAKSRAAGGATMTG